MKFRYNKVQVAVLTAFLVYVTLHCVFVYYQVGKAQPLQTTPNLLGLPRDSHDIQWEAFRRNFPVMLTIAIVSTYVLPRQNPMSQILVGFGMALFSFRADILLYSSVLLVYYFVCKSLYKYKHFQAIIWTMVVLHILLHDASNRLRFISQFLNQSIPIDFLKPTNSPIHWGSILNMSLLKLLSYGVDNHRAYFKKEDMDSHTKKCGQCKQQTPCLDARDKMSCPLQMNLSNFLSYILFPPTFLAGPPISYNSFHSFKSRPLPKNANNPIPRFLLVMLTFEIFQVILPCCKVLPENSLFQLQLISLVTLLFIWYKFIVIWRWAKVWSYMYGIQVIDNMNRCVINNYGFEGFWRMWHRGFNKWLIRYLYIPLGGNKKMLVSFVCVFGFVALWHDVEIKLLLWVLGIVPAILLEVNIKRYFRHKQSKLFHKHWFKYLSALCGSIEIYIMCMANIVGFGFGLEGLLVILGKFTSLPTLLASLGTLIMAVVLMFYQRDELQVKKVGF